MTPLSSPLGASPKPHDLAALPTAGGPHAAAVPGALPADPARAVREFEAFFIGQLFAEMRKTVESINEDSSFGASYFNGMLDEQLAQACAAGGSFGLSDMLGRELGITKDGPQVMPTSVDVPAEEGGKP